MIYVLVVIVAIVGPDQRGGNVSFHDFNDLESCTHMLEVVAQNLVSPAVLVCVEKGAS